MCVVLARSFRLKEGHDSPCLTVVSRTSSSCLPAAASHKYTCASSVQSGYGEQTINSVPRTKSGTNGPEQVLYAFMGGSDGADPSGGLIFDSNGNLYGTTQYGGGGACSANGYTGCGTVFKLSPNSTAGRKPFSIAFKGERWTKSDQRPGFRLVREALWYDLGSKSLDKGATFAEYHIKYWCQLW